MAKVNRVKKINKKNYHTPSAIEADRQYGTNWDAEFKNPKQYIELKLIMLRNEMYIEPTQDEIDHLNKLTTEGDINRAVHSIIDNHWG